VRVPQYLERPVKLSSMSGFKKLLFKFQDVHLIKTVVPAKSVVPGFNPFEDKELCFPSVSKSMF